MTVTPDPAGSPTDEPLLSVKGLGLRITVADETEPRLILKDVGFSIREHEAVALVGESGSGKSMTARSLIRLVPPHGQLSGDVRFRGEQVMAMDPPRLLAYRRREVAMVFQDPRAHIDPTRTVGDYLTERLRLAGTRSREAALKRAVELLGDVRIDRPAHRLEQYPHELSGGMLQRVMIAGALSAEPTLLLADEPTTALDVVVQADILRALAELRAQRGLAMLLVTHDLALAEKTCDRTVVMYAGRVIEVNESPSIERTGVHPYTIGLAQSRPSIEQRRQRLEALPGRAVAAAGVVDACAFASRCRLADSSCREAEPELRPFAASLVACIHPQQAAELRGLAVSGPAGPLTATADGELLVEVSDLRREFSRRRLLRVHPTAPTVAVDDVSFTVSRGESLAIVGESGSGKTTIARLLLGLDRPTSGSIKVAGHARNGLVLDGLSRRATAKQIQIVFQDPYQSLDPSQTVGAALREVVSFALGLRGDELEQRVERLAKAVELEPLLLTRYPRALSGGQRQRAAIARALASEPSVLVLDEATASLDASIQAQILNLLSDLRAQLNLTYVFITHDLAVVRQISDTMIVINAGRVVERGRVATVLDDPQEQYTKRLVGSSPSRMEFVRVASNSSTRRLNA